MVGRAVYFPEGRQGPVPGREEPGHGAHEEHAVSPNARAIADDPVNTPGAAYGST